MSCNIIITTYPDHETATREALRMVEKRVAACVNLLEVKSIYRWKDKIETSSETLAICKTLTRASERLKASIKSRHPYEVPEILELNVKYVDEGYLKWLEGCIRRG